MLSMSYEEYDKLLETFEEIKTGEKVISYWPTVPQVDLFWEDPEKWIYFCCYLYEFNDPPKTAEEKYSKKNLFEFINRNLQLVDESDFC